MNPLSAMGITVMVLVAVIAGGIFTVDRAQSKFGMDPFLATLGYVFAVAAVAVLAGYLL